VKALFKSSFYCLTFILILALASPSEIFAQNGLRIYDDIGGGSNNTEPTTNDDNTFIYVAGGLLIAGIIAYALFVKKDNKPAETDTTASVDSRLIYSDSNLLSPDDELMKAKEKIPVDLFLGVKNNEALTNDKTYLVGLRVKF
jgi:LPXTG-motif cell wall-anchored protein